MADTRMTKLGDHPIVEAAKASLNPVSVGINGALVGAGAVNALAGGALARKLIAPVEHFSNGGIWHEAAVDFGGGVALDLVGVGIAYKAKDLSTAARVGGLLVAGTAVGAIAAPVMPHVVSKVDEWTTKIAGFFGKKPAAAGTTSAPAKDVNPAPANPPPPGPTLTGQSLGSVGGLYELTPGGGSFYDVAQPTAGGSRFTLRNRYPTSSM
jgi:hypothetical protein